MTLFLNIIATLFLVGVSARQAFSALEVWVGPYPEKGKYALISGGVVLGSLVTVWAVWS